MDFQLFLLVLFSVIWACIFFITSNSKHRKSAKLPPGPYPFPIIGNILQLGENPHQSLAKLSQTYGPLMHLKMGYRETIVVSSPEMAKIVLQKYDQTFSSRTVPVTLESVEHGKFSMGFMPVDNQWRKLRRILKEQMFSLQRLDASQGIRREKLQKLYEYVNQCRVNGHAVDIAEATFTTSLNTISSTLFSVDFADFDSDSSQEFKDVVWNVMKCIGSPNLADYFPVLKYVDPQGISRRTKFYFGKLYAILDSIIDQRLISRGTSEKNDLLEALLDLYQKPEPELSRNEIRHILMDLFFGSTDTVPSTVEWAMAELLRNPKTMSRAKKELSEVIGEHGVIQESDISKLPYLQALVKETHRLHPVAPLLVPHKAEADVEINGYIVPKNAQILVNTWATSRDSNIWSSSDSFMPERFLDRKIDFNGQDFKFIPFGAGRRMCPGLPLANRVVHVMLATLIHNFDWKLEQGLKPEEIDMSEKFTTTLHKAIPLKAFPIKL
ncbi:ferruginol synthase-like [Olea europaea subsp. europaea]|uniref:Ferruginol synthase-like n=1 Tax=Olea europaea subsp. europaea TaxID=158383 RepID=A0A8S0S2L8_OLEEU|nr:ferruginol synthase-like [Olea europaea subsp. europaea]